VGRAKEGDQRLSVLFQPQGLDGKGSFESMKKKRKRGKASGTRQALKGALLSEKEKVKKTVQEVCWRF